MKFRNEFFSDNNFKFLHKLYFLTILSDKYLAFPVKHFKCARNWEYQAHYWIPLK